MPDRIQRNEFVRRLAVRMNADEEMAERWVDAMIDTLYESFKAGESVKLTGFGSFHVRPERSSWVFRFNPGQKLRTLFGWSPTYRGEL